MSDQPVVWCLMPIMAHPVYTRAAIADLLAQSVPVRLLLINQGVEDAFRDELEQIAEADDRVLLWSHVPPLPSLAATWNRALDFVWATGGQEALVVNNDVRLDPWTVAILHRELVAQQALFVSCVGWDEAHWQQEARPAPPAAYLDHGGPDFSCFLLSREGHTRYRFAEGFIPAYGEDCDTHRRYMLGGDAGSIFSINLPYLHYGSATLKSLPQAARAQLEQRIGQGSRAYYAKKWGGPVNAETYTIPFDADSAQAHVTNPELQAGVEWKA